ncbi:TlpA family protein disulfide reductase [Anatilimnocola aggregata]|nr:TlpA disulfide reductase family protein [Anatilimnocola aggregata]
MNRVMTWGLLLGGEAALAVLVGATFWYQDAQYSLPTPRPLELVQPALGEVVELPELNHLRVDDIDPRPTLLHFFNPSCPCSRFNLTHVRELIHEFGPRVKVVAVLQTKQDTTALSEFKQLKLPCPALVDRQGNLAQRLGVYSTPQAVVLDAQGTLFYRGNYNLSRYCIAPDSQFVVRALKACLADEPLPRFEPIAMVAQGCPLPNAAHVVQEKPAP